MNFFKCDHCSYFSDRKYNLQQHISNKHHTKYENNKIAKMCENVVPNEENVVPNEENVVPNEENVVPKKENVVPKKENVGLQYFCKKCKKHYKTIKYLQIHEINCKGIDELTCPKCMISFCDRHAKFKHIKRNNCKARSIIHAREPNPQNIIHNQTINNIQNNNTQNIFINNFGNERLDHISYDEIVKMLLSGDNTIPMLIEKKHFDKNFPENNNIMYTKENKCKVMENNSWKEKNISLVSSKLIKDNSGYLLLFCSDNKICLTEDIESDEVLDFIKHKLMKIYHKDDDKYKEIYNMVNDIIKNT